jgi:DNA-binding response OmpR family regulator
MRFAIVDADPVMSAILAGAAQRRGHQAVCVSELDRLLLNLPFAPSVVVAGIDDVDEATTARLIRLREHHADATLIASIEDPSPTAQGALLRLGVNDVVRAPYNPVDLLIKAETWDAARHLPPPITNAVTVADISVDLGHYFARKNGRALVLTKLELRLLFALCEHYPHLVSVERLLSFGWDATDDPDPTLIKTHISHLRHKLADAGGVPVEIRSRQTIGYLLQLDGADA